MEPNGLYPYPAPLRGSTFPTRGHKGEGRPPMTSKQKVAALAAWSIVIAFGVLLLKAAAWWLTGSVALFSDALESIVNVIASGAALYAIRLSHKPADQNHPFGHHKAEYFSAVLEGVLIVVAALLIPRGTAQGEGAPA